MQNHTCLLSVIPCSVPTLLQFLTQDFASLHFFIQLRDAEDD